MRIIINNSKDSNKHKKIFRKYFFEVFNRVYTTSPNIAIIRRFEEEAKEKNTEYTILKISKKIPGEIEIEKKVVTSSPH